jgi:hypothetical protein
MKAAAHVFQSGAEAGQRVRLQIDIAECDDACSRGNVADISMAARRRVA